MGLRPIGSCSFDPKLAPILPILSLIKQAQCSLIQSSFGQVNQASQPVASPAPRAAPQQRPIAFCSFCFCFQLGFMQRLSLSSFHGLLRTSSELQHFLALTPKPTSRPTCSSTFPIAQTCKHATGHPACQFARPSPALANLRAELLSPSSRHGRLQKQHATASVSFPMQSYSSLHLHSNLLPAHLPDA